MQPVMPCKLNNHNWNKRKFNLKVTVNAVWNSFIENGNIINLYSVFTLCTGTDKPKLTAYIQTRHCRTITKTCLYNTGPLKPHFYIVKLGFTGVYIIFPISAQKAVLMSTYNLCFEQKYEKYQSFLSKNFQFLEVKFSIYLNRHVFIMTVSDQGLHYLH